MSAAGSRRSPAPGRRVDRARTITVLVVSLAVSIGVLTAVQPGAAAAITAVLAFAAALLLPTRPLVGPIELSGKRFRWVAFAWAYVMIRPIGHFTTGRTTLTAVAGVPSIENVIDLGTHAAIAALAL